ncbi:MAG: hypothetical protein ABWX65_12010 [Mycetocola sp.]
MAQAPAASWSRPGGDDAWQYPSPAPAAPPQPGYAPPGSGQNPYQQNPQQPSWGYQGPPPFPSAPAAWTPPPKPGLIPLRPLGFGTLLGAPFLTLKRNPKATFGSALLVQAITVVVSLIVIGLVTWFVISRITAAAPEDVETVAAGGITAIILGSIVPFLISIAGTVFLQGVIVTEAARSTLGEKLTLGATWKATWPRLGPLLLWTLLAGGAVTVVIAAIVGIVWLLVVLGGGFIAAGVILAIMAALALVVVGVWLGVKLSLVPSAIVLERAGVIAAIRRSWRLVDGYFWKTLGIQYLIAFIVGTVSQVVLTPISIIYMMSVSVIDPTGATAEDWIAPAVLYIALIIVSLLVASITSVVQSATLAFIYIDLRMRKEGLDLELIRFVEARQSGDASVADPYLVRTTGTAAGSPWA